LPDVADVSEDEEHIIDESDETLGGSGSGGGGGASAAAAVAVVGIVVVAMTMLGCKHTIRSTRDIVVGEVFACVVVARAKMPRSWSTYKSLTCVRLFKLNGRSMFVNNIILSML